PVPQAQPHETRACAVHSVTQQKLPSNHAAAQSSPGFTLPGMQPVSDDISALAGQVFYLDWHGEQGVLYDGPVRMDGIEVTTYQAPGPWAGDEPSIIGSALDELNETFADVAVTFTDVLPDAGTDHSTILLGGDDSAFAQYGSFRGLAEKIDVGNR